MNEPKKQVFEGRINVLSSIGGHQTTVLLVKGGPQEGVDLGHFLEPRDWGRKNVRITVEELP